MRWHTYRGNTCREIIKNNCASTHDAFSANFHSRNEYSVHSNVSKLTHYNVPSKVGTGRNVDEITDSAFVVDCCSRVHYHTIPDLCVRINDCPRHNNCAWTDFRPAADTAECVYCGNQRESCLLHELA